MNRLLIFQQRPAIQFHILVHLQRAISRIRRQHQLFALGGVEAALLVARGNAGFFRNNPDLIQTQTIGFARVVLRVAHPGTRAHDLELARRHLLFVAHAVLVLHRPFQHIGQDLHVFVRVGTEALTGVDDVVVNHPQGGEAHKVRVIIVGERESMPGIQPAMVSVATFVRFA